MSQKEKRLLVPQLLQIIFIVLLIAVGWFCYRELKTSKVMPIKEVKLTATYQHFSPQVLQAIILPYVSNVGLFSIDIEALKQALLQQPWVGQIFIKRIWPDEIDISIEEQTPIAIWNKTSLLNLQGDVFTPNKNQIPASLPDLEGPINQQNVVMQQWQEFNRQLIPLHLTIPRLVMNSRGAWQMVLSNDTTINLGRIDINARFAQLLQLYPKILAGHENQIPNIDLRYSNGFAIQWQANLPLS